MSHRFSKQWRARGYTLRKPNFTTASLTFVKGDCWNGHSFRKTPISQQGTFTSVSFPLCFLIREARCRGIKNLSFRDQSRLESSGESRAWILLNIPSILIPLIPAIITHKPSGTPLVESVCEKDSRRLRNLVKQSRAAPLHILGSAFQISSTQSHR